MFKYFTSGAAAFAKMLHEVAGLETLVTTLAVLDTSATLAELLVWRIGSSARTNLPLLSRLAPAVQPVVLPGRLGVGCWNFGAATRIGCCAPAGL